MTPSAAPRLYATLGIARGAVPAAIREAYKRLAFDNHPDRNPGDVAAQERFVAIAEAYGVLADPARRRDYDAFGDEALTKGFGKTTAAGPGPLDLHVAMVLAPTVAERGGTVRLTLKRRRPCTSCVGREPPSCSRCTGSGRSSASQLARCRDCKGGRGGAHRGPRRGLRANAPTPGREPDAPCATCEGRGVARVSCEVRCAPCRGTGTLACLMCRGEKEATSSVVVALPFPPGVVDGACIRFTGKGHTSTDGEAGNLWVDIRLDRAPTRDPELGRRPAPAVKCRPVRRAVSR